MPSMVMPRHGRYGARVEIRGKLKWLGTFDTPEEAWGEVHRVRRAAAPQARTVQDWSDVWLDLYGGNANQETLKNIAQRTKRFVREHGRMRLENVTVLIAQRHANEDPGSVRYLRQMWARAMDAGLVEENPWSKVRVTLRKTPRRPVTAEELFELATVFGERWGEHWHDMLLFTGYSGLRMCEVRAMQGEDVIPGTHRLNVRGKRLGGQRLPRMRQVVVFEPGWEALLRQLRGGRVWRNRPGKPLTRELLGSRMDEARTALQLGPDVTFHSLRHFHAGWLLDRGASYLDVAVQLGHMTRDGHANPSLVERVYGRPSPGAALDRLQELL